MPIPVAETLTLAGELPSLWGFFGGSHDKETTCNAGDPGSIPGSGRAPGEGKATLSNILAWRIPWTEDSSRLQSLRSQRVGQTE